MRYYIQMVSIELCGLWPPVKIGMGPDELWHGLSRETSLHLDLLQFVKVMEMPIGQCFVRQVPQPFGRLRVGRIEGQHMQV